MKEGITFQKKEKKKVLWKLSLFACLWKLWLERNSRVFTNTSTRVDNIVDSIVWTVSGWASKEKDFIDMSMFDLNTSWEAYFQRGTKGKSVQISSCKCPLNGVLKINFDGSFIEGAKVDFERSLGIPWVNLYVITLARLIVRIQMRQRFLQCSWDAAN